MAAYVALLGSINVGGNRIKMADLKAALVEAGFDDPQTVSASGNVIFDHARAAEAGLDEKIEALIQQRFGFKAFATVRTHAEIVAAIDNNPFASGGEEKFVHSCFLDGPVTDAAVAKLDEANPGDERLAAGKRILFVDFKGGVADSKLTNRLIEKHLGRRSTARNLRSLARIAAAMKDRT